MAELNQPLKPKSGKDAAIPGSRVDRQYVRIYYPLDCPLKYLPVLTIRYRNYQLLDISEAGLCFQVPRIHLLSEDILTGTIKFLDESVIEFSGVVVRRAENQIALKLIVGIPYSHIASEQVRLRTLEAEGVIKLANR